MAGTKRKLDIVLIKWFVLIGILGSFLSLATYFYIVYDSIKIYAFQNLASIRDHQVLLINTWFEERTRDIKILSCIPDLNKNDLSKIKEVLNIYSANDYGFKNYFYADTQGQILVMATPDDTGIDIRDRSYYKAAMEGKDYISEILVSRRDGSRIIIISSPVFSGDGRVIGLVAGSLALDRIDGIVATFKAGKTGETYLVDKWGIMLSESRFTSSLIEKGLTDNTTKYYLDVYSEGVKRVIQGQAGYIEYKNYRGVQVLGAYQWVPQYQWGLIAEIEKKEVFGNWFDRIALVLVVLMFLTILLLYPLAKIIAGKIAPPLTALSDKVSHFAGDYKSASLSWTVMDTPAYEELEVLQDSFFKMGEEMVQLMNIMEIQALHDPLTGLANRRYFLERGREVIELSRRRKTPCTMIYFDIDRFKKINDTYGHTVGDEVLAAIARIVRENVRINDYAGRLGGEEFAVVSPDTDEEGALKLAERLRQYIEITPVASNNHRIFATVSLGVVTYRNNNDRRDAREALEELLRQADTAMYRAKELGRNRVEVYQEHGINMN